MTTLINKCKHIHLIKKTAIYIVGIQNNRYNNERLFTKSNIQSFTDLLWFAVATADAVMEKTHWSVTLVKPHSTVQSFCC